MEMSD